MASGLTGLLPPAPTALNGLEQPNGLESLSGLAGLTGQAANPVDSVTGIIGGPLGAVSAIGAGALAGIDPSGVLTDPVGALTGVLGQGPLGVLTSTLEGVLGQLQGLTAQLIPQVDAILRPVAQVSGVIGVVTIPRVLPIAVPSGTSVPPTGSATYPSPAPPRAGPVPTGTARTSDGQAAAGGVDFQHVASPPAAPAQQHPGADGNSSTVRVLRGLRPPPTRCPGLAPAHLMSGQRHDPFSPGDPSNPLSGSANRALPTSSQNDGTGDAAPPWEARVTEVSVPAWVVAPPAVRTAADELAFSPD
jgi:hypothetical protein